jgi:hypothetical protein
MGKTHSKPLAARHGRGTAWARQVMCESAFTVSETFWNAQNVDESQSGLRRGSSIATTPILQHKFNQSNTPLFRLMDILSVFG